MKTQPAWINKSLFPFHSQWMEIDHQHLHYIDEGAGPVLLFAHGTPEWSFGFRDLIQVLRNDYRCIAIDMLGFGLSDKPEDGVYTCQAHADRFEKIMDRLALKNVTLVANDFGGGIALNYAIRHPENIASIVLFNTWMRSLKDDKHYSGPAKMMRGWFGRFLYYKLNFPVNVIMPAAFGDKRKLTKEIHRHYKEALPAGERIAAYAFSRELLQASDWWESLWSKLTVINNKPMLIFWGMKDKFVPPYELENWKRKLPSAKVIPFEDAGHFVQEEKPEEMVREIRKFLDTRKEQ